MYYYHAITRKTQWEVPTGQDEITVTMDLGTPDISSGEEGEEPGNEVGVVMGYGNVCDGGGVRLGGGGKG